jgi:hypothetical protein
MVALTFGANGVLYGAEAGDSTDYFTICLAGEAGCTAGQATGVPTTGAPAGGINAAGDLEVIGNIMYVTTGGIGGISSLGEINLTTGVFTNLGVIETSGAHPTRFRDVYGVAVANGYLYGFTASGSDVLDLGPIADITHIVSVDSASAYTEEFYGATDNVSTAPEPATLGVLGLGLLGLGGFGYRRRRG